MAKSNLVGNLIIRLGADSTQLDSSLQRTQKRIGTFSKKTRRRMNVAGKSFAGFAAKGAAALAAVTAGAVAMNYQMGRTAAQLQNFAQANGTSVNEVEKLQFALQKVGSETSAQDVIKDLNDRVGDLRVTGGGPLVDIIDRIGISAEQLATMNPTQQLDAIGKAIENLPTASKVNVLESISGDASELLPLLDNGSQKLNQFSKEAESLGVLTSGKLRAGLVSSYQSMFNLRAVAGKAAKIIGSVLSPYISTLVDYLSAATSHSERFADKFVTGFEAAIRYVGRFADVLNALEVVFQGVLSAGAAAIGFIIIGFENLIKSAYASAAAVTKLIRAIADGYNTIPALPEIDTDGLSDKLAYYREQIKNTAKDQEKWSGRISAVGHRMQDALTRQTPSSVVENWLDDVHKKADETAKSVEKVSNGDQKPNKNIENWTNVPDPGPKLPSSPQARQYDVTMDVPERPKIMSQGQMDQDRIGDLQGTLTSYDSMAEKINKINDGYRSNIDLINRAAQRRQITGDQQTRLLDKLAEKRDEDLQKAKSSAEQMSQFSKQASRNIQDELGNTIEDTLKGNFDGILKSWVDMLADMAAQAASANILKGLFGEGQGSGGGLLGSVGGFGGIASALGGFGSSIGGFISGFLADGGPAKAGRSYIVGEQGPELFSPRTSGTVIPNHDLGSGGRSVGGSRVNVSIVNQGNGNLEVTGRERRRNSDGSEDIKIAVRSALSDLSNTGEIEDVMGPYQLNRKQTTS